MRFAFKIMALAPIALLCACTNSNSAGSTTETENAIASVSISVTDGARAAYRVLPNSFVADTSGSPVVDSDYTFQGKADGDGMILIEEHPEGSFTIEIERGDSAIAFQYTLDKENSIEVLRLVVEVHGALENINSNQGR